MSVEEGKEHGSQPEVPNSSCRGSPGRVVELAPSENWPMVVVFLKHQAQTFSELLSATCRLWALPPMCVTRAVSV